jgi:hypothetical protein
MKFLLVSRLRRIRHHQIGATSDDLIEYPDIVVVDPVVTTLVCFLLSPLFDALFLRFARTGIRFATEGYEA